MSSSAAPEELAGERSRRLQKTGSFSSSVQAVEGPYRGFSIVQGLKNTRGQQKTSFAFRAEEFMEGLPQHCY